MIWIPVGLMVLAIVVYLIVAGGFYRRLFSEEHFLEVAQGIGDLKQAALERVSSSVDTELTPSDPRTLITSSRLAIVYSITREDSSSTHHVSISVAGRYTAHAVGSMFMLLWAKVLGFPYERLSLMISKQSVHHGEIVLTKEEQRAFVERLPLEPTPELIRSLREEWMAVQQRLQWQRGKA